MPYMKDNRDREILISINEYYELLFKATQYDKLKKVLGFKNEIIYQKEN